MQKPLRKSQKLAGPLKKVVEEYNRLQKNARLKRSDLTEVTKDLMRLGIAYHFNPADLSLVWSQVDMLLGENAATGQVSSLSASNFIDSVQSIRREASAIIRRLESNRATPGRAWDPYGTTPSELTSYTKRLSN